MNPEDFLHKLDVSRLKAGSRRRGSRKISSRVFDDSTLSTLAKLHSKGCFDTVESIVSQGKEANIYYGMRGGSEVAVKIYCYETSDFKNMVRYVRGDPRFGNWRNRRQLVDLWAQKEYKNLMRVSGEVSSPQPIGWLGNVLVMDFIGDGGYPAPRIRESGCLGGPADYYARILDEVKTLFECRLVHCDLSEYNILDMDGPVIIDLSAGVLLDHPEADSFLRRDLHNVCKYFGKLGVQADEEAAYRHVTEDG